MTDKNDALFLVRLPFGQKTIPYEKVPELIAMAKSPGYDGEHKAVMLALDVCHEEGLLRAAVQAGEVEVLDKSLHRMTQPFNGRLKDTVLTVQALREYVESIKGFLEVEVEAKQADAKQADAKETPKANTRKWGDEELRALWNESNMPYVTRISLAQKHGVSPKRISALLQKAKGKFSASGKSKNLIPAVGRTITFGK